MRKAVLFFLFVVIQYNPVAAQANITALQKQLNNIKEDTAGIRLLNNLAGTFYEKEQLDSCGKYAYLAHRYVCELLQKDEVKKNTAYTNDCKQLKAHSLENISLSLVYKNTPASLDTMQAALRLWIEAGNKKNIAGCHTALAEIYNTQSDYVNALKNYQSALALYKQLADRSKTGYTLYNIGLTQRYMANYGDALENTLSALQVGKEINDKTLVTFSLLANAFTYLAVKSFPDALKNQQDALKIYRESNDSTGIATVYNDLGVLYDRWGKKDEALNHHMKALGMRKLLHENLDIANSNSYISDLFRDKEDYTAALKYAMEALRYAKLVNNPLHVTDMYMSVADIYYRQHDEVNAMKYYDTAMQISGTTKNLFAQSNISRSIADIYSAKGQTDSAITWLRKAVTLVPENAYKSLLLIYAGLYNAFAQKNDYRNAYGAHLKFSIYSDSAAAAEKALKIKTLTTQLEFENKQALMKAGQDKQFTVQQSEIRQQKLVKNITIAGLLIVIILAVLFFKRFREKQQLSKTLENTVHDLRATQSQLIQSEKMASLGELTAGVAHEIQNPLNFVNNFSEVSAELIKEMVEEVDKGNSGEVKTIANDLKQNLEKINHHGKRADAIVKGMLQHSRSSGGQKEPTDINELADEYLRLTYHGLRAKDKSFNATIKTDFDKNIGKIKVVPQDMGRVLLNLMNNAFYAVIEKKKQQPGDHYEPTVTVRTSKTPPPAGGGRGVVITVTDNGNGIPKNIVDKIFQPFFTTKPTGQGTGLGLSLSYDIVTKGHRGELKVETQDGVGSTFIIVLPIND